jgi:hypothetical protein
MSAVVVHGRRPLVTVASLAVAVVVGGLLGSLAMLAPQLVVFWGFELVILGTATGILLGIVASRNGGSLVGAMFLASVTYGVVTVRTVLRAGHDPVVFVATVVFLVAGVAVPAGMLAYALGVRWRTGPWEDSLWAHLEWQRGSSRVLVGWTLGSGLLVGSLVLAQPVVNLGIVQFGLLVGGLLVAAACGWRGDGVGTALGVGVVSAVGVALAFALGTTLNAPFTVRPSARTVGMLLAFGLGGGAPLGVVGYVAGRAVREDARLTTGNLDGL